MTRPAAPGSHVEAITRLLYVGAADYLRPISGMDIGSKCHLEELSDDGRFTMTAISAAPFSLDPAGRPSRLVQMFAGDLRPGMSRLARLKLKAGILARGGILYQSAFRSARARAAIKAGLADRPDVLFVDHVIALANISLWQLLALRLRRKSRIVVVAHDQSSMLIHDRALLQKSRVKALLVRLHALHCHLYEHLVFRLADRVWFVSTDDRRRFGHLHHAKSQAACQIIEWPDIPADADFVAGFGRYLVFVGSPSFFPNGAAIDWIVQKFAPELLALMPELTVLLVGKHTDRVNAAGLPNLKGLGFLDDRKLNQLVHAATAVISPVVHGAGIKIKVLEAIAAEKPVFATEHSLRGYDFLQVDPILDVDDPAGSANRVCAIVGDPDRLHAIEQHVSQRWTEYKAFRRGRLADFVFDLTAYADCEEAALAEPVNP